MDPELLAFIAQAAGAVDAHAMSLGQRRLDANETAFLARELEQIRSADLNVEYPAAKALAMIPIATDIDPLARTFVSRVYDITGGAKVVADDASDLPECDVVVSEESGVVRKIGTSYSISTDDMLRSARFGVPLDRKKATAARFHIDRCIDEILRTGNNASMGQTLGLTGFVDASGVDDNPGTFHNWYTAATTGEEIVSDLTIMYNAIKTRTLDIYEPDTFILASALYTLATSKRMLYSDKNPIQAFMASFPNIRAIDSWVSLNNAGGSSKHRIIAYPKSPGIVEGVVPNRFTQLPAQQRGLKLSTPCYGSCGGVIVHRPGAMQYGDFAASA